MFLKFLRSHMFQAGENGLGSSHGAESEATVANRFSWDPLPF